MLFLFLLMTAGRATIHDLLMVKFDFRVAIKKLSADFPNCSPLMALFTSSPLISMKELLWMGIVIFL
ncbi:MAG TPA: hypothetical protein DD473_27550 [Planctomycetaceae bacterium]|nr:hypothetical protein [Planctomycetaceae bacterium]